MKQKNNSYILIYIDKNEKHSAENIYNVLINKYKCLYCEKNSKVHINMHIKMELRKVKKYENLIENIDYIRCPIDIINFYQHFYKLYLILWEHEIKNNIDFICNKINNFIKSIL